VCVYKTTPRFFRWLIRNKFSSYIRVNTVVLFLCQELMHENMTCVKYKCTTPICSVKCLIRINPRLWRASPWWSWRILHLFKNDENSSLHIKHKTVEIKYRDIKKLRLNSVRYYWNLSSICISLLEINFSLMNAFWKGRRFTKANFHKWWNERYTKNGS
jgi:hypothetical protein